MSRYVLGFLLLLLGAVAVYAQEPILTSVRLEPALVSPNLAPNGGFEALGENGLPSGWLWDRRNTDGTVAVDTQVVHGGKRSLRFSSTTPFGANVYAGLWRAAPIPLTAGKPYTLSAYVRSDRGGAAWIGGGHDWQFRLSVPATGNAWRRVAMTFVPQPDDAQFGLRINLDAQVQVWVDDMKLEEGDHATPAGIPEDAAGPEIEFTPERRGPERRTDVPVVEIESGARVPEAEVQGDGTFALSFTLRTARNLPDAIVEVDLPALHRSLRQPVTVNAGAWRIVVEGKATGVSTAPRVLRARLLSAGQEVTHADILLDFQSAANTETRLASLRHRLPPLAALLAKIHASGQDTAYPMVSYTVLQNFVDYVDQDLTGNGGRAQPEVKRAIVQLDDLETMADRLDKDLRQHLAGRRYPDVPRWTGDRRPRIQGSSFLATTRVSGHPDSPGQRPVFFVGYGHFGQVVADIEKFPRYGVNVIQIELGPSSVFPREGVVDEAPIQEMRKVLDRAQKAGVAVALLISPHYFPDWLRAKYADLQKRREGFLQYSLYAPEGQELLKRFLHLLIPPLKDSPALQSIVLSNEPINVEEPGPQATRDWHAWLAKRHGAVAALNRSWGTTYAGFEEIALPDPFHPPGPSPLWMDYARFNQEFFAGWHAMLADTIRRIAPNLPVHAKAMTWTFLLDPAVRFGVDAYLFGKFSDINGNDSSDTATYDAGEFAENWQEQAMGYDLQRSVRNAPIFNTENHLIPDRETRPVPPAHIRAALWQGAVHGQSTTTIWVWERTFDPNGDFAGDIMHRPACAEAVGIVNHDLNRAAREVTALQQAPPQALILQSVTASVWDASRYGDCLNKLYTALDFTGVKVGFIEERQLEDGVLPTAPVLFVPNILHLSDAAVHTLERYRGRLVFVGEGDLLSRDEFDHPRPTHPNGDRLSFVYGKTVWRDLFAQLLPHLPGWNLTPAVQSLDTQGKPVWGVEYRSAATPGGLIVNLCNYRQEALAVSLLRHDRPISAVDVLSGERVQLPIILHPLEVRLLKIRDPGHH